MSGIESIGNRINKLVISFLILFYLLSPALLHAGTSANLALKSWVYDYLERLEARGFIKSGILSTKPISRLEGRRLVDEALSLWNGLPDTEKEEMQEVYIMLNKLYREFSGELTSQGYFTPIDTAYLRYLYSDNTPDHLTTNNNGDILTKEQNVRIGISSALELLDYVSFYYNPEIRVRQNDWKVISGYGLLSIHNVDLVIGREPIWWGPGHHGALLMTNNAQPFDMVRLTSQSPFLLPWIFRWLGQFKPTLFVTQLEENRDYPHAKLMGMRLDFRTLSSFRFALSRVIMFGGEGRKGLTISDWFNILIANDNTEHGWTSSDIDNNQIMSLDFSVVINGLDRSLPFEGLKIYGEIGAEDSSGNGWPTERAYLAGLFVEEPAFFPNTSMRIEWATTAKNKKYSAWYTHGIYSTGYRYKGRIIGHHMGADAEDIFARLEHSVGRGTKIGIEADIERKDIHAESTGKRIWVGLDLRYMLRDTIDIGAGYGVEDFNDGGSASSVAWSTINWEF